ncbi:MAG TPA: hypothetical protein VHV83_05495 [Armatimonadota bacterium]|nr:hypothetical protein [Armatimonadota bacterium]
MAAGNPVPGVMVQFDPGVTIADPMFSPRGGVVAFSMAPVSTTTAPVWNIGIYDLTAQRTTVVVRNAMQPVFSPDGTRLAYSQNGDIFAMNGNGSNRVQLTTGLAYDTRPTWWGIMSR